MSDYDVGFGKPPKHSQFQKGNIHGTTHLYSGQEASGVGVGSMLREGDKVAGTYRGHGHSIAHGVSPQKLMDEMLGRETGACGGRAGSMNVVDVESGLIGCFGIVGGSIGAATGAALSEKLLKTKSDRNPNTVLVRHGVTPLEKKDALKSWIGDVIGCFREAGA